MNQKWHTIINGMSNEQMLRVMKAYGFNPEAWSNLRESLRLKLMFNDIPTKALENYMGKVFKEGQQVRVIKGRVPSDPIVGKTGTVVGSTNDLSFFWVVCLDGQTYTDDDFGGELLRTDEIETLY